MKREINKLQPFDTIHCKHRPKFTAVGIGSGVIRKLCEYDHTATVYRNLTDGKLYVVEASFGKKGVHDTELTAWITKKMNSGCYLYVTRPVDTIDIFRAYRIIHKVLTTKHKYDNAGALFFQLIYQTTRIIFKKPTWLGRKADDPKADDRFYCSELAMYIRNDPRWFKADPGYCANHPGYVYLMEFNPLDFRE